MLTSAVQQSNSDRDRQTDIGFPGALVVKNPPGNAGDTGDAGSVPGSGRSPGAGHGNQLQYSCLENPMYRAAWQATVHKVTKRDMPEAT